eukprot:1229569-Amphidinium_carterae.1
MSLSSDGFWLGRSCLLLVTVCLQAGVRLIQYWKEGCRNIACCGRWATTSIHIVIERKTWGLSVQTWKANQLCSTKKVLAARIVAKRRYRPLRSTVCVFNHRQGELRVPNAAPYHKTSSVRQCVDLIMGCYSTIRGVMSTLLSDDCGARSECLQWEQHLWSESHDVEEPWTRGQNCFGNSLVHSGIALSRNASFVEGAAVSVIALIVTSRMFITLGRGWLEVCARAHNKMQHMLQGNTTTASSACSHRPVG